MVRLRTIFTLLVMLTASGTCLGQKVAYETLYDLEGTEFVIAGETSRNVHYIALEGTLGKTGRLMLDGNVCVLDKFGERSTCTLVFYAPLDVELREIDADGDSVLYEIIPKDQRIANFTLRLAVNKSRPSTANLLLNSAFAPQKILDTKMMRETELEAFEEKVQKLTASQKRDAKTHVVRMEGLEFVPETIIIDSGDSIVWECVSLSHNAQRDDSPSFCTVPEEEPDCPNPCRNDACLLTPGQKSLPVKFAERGTFDYFCRPHKGLGMTGKIIVQ